MTDVEHALELLLERVFVEEGRIAPVQRMTAGRLETALADPRCLASLLHGAGLQRVEGFLEAVGM